MKKFLKDVADRVFSFGTFMIIMVVVFGYLIGATLDQSKKQTQACFNHQMVKVNTDAGAKCVKVEALVNING